MPHSTLRAGTNGWTDRDRLLAVALTVFEDSLHSCGHPIDEALAEDDLTDGFYEVVEHRCEACATLQRYRSHREGQEHKPGTTVSVVNKATAADWERVRRIRALRSQTDPVP